MKVIDQIRNKIAKKQKLTKAEKEYYIFYEYDVDLKECYKHRYLIAFYTENERNLMDFTNIKQIADYLDINYNTKEFKTLKSRISNCLKENCTLKTPYIYLKDVKVRPYLIDLLEDIA